MTDTAYAVFKQQKDVDGSFVFTKRTTSSTREGAAKKVALEIAAGADAEIANGNYLAIPASQYEVIPVEIEIEAKAIVKK